MNDLNIIDKFTQTFVTYIDSGFGLLSGDVSFLTTTLVAIDVVMAGLGELVDDIEVIHFTVAHMFAWGNTHPPHGRGAHAFGLEIKEA